MRNGQAKTPQLEIESLKKDRRNDYGEDPAASRKGIRRAKQASHKNQRSRFRLALAAAALATAEECDIAVREAEKVSKLKSFRKKPDVPLGEILRRKLRRPGIVQ